MTTRKPATKAPAKKAAVKKKVNRQKRAPEVKALSIELMCQEFILNGGDQSKAYRKAFPASAKWKPETVHVKASIAFSDDKVKVRLSELQEEARKIAEDQFQIDARYVLNRLAEIDRMDFADIFTEDGNGLLPPREWPLVWRQYISGFDFSEIWEGGADQREMVGMLKKIKWPDKVKNLEMLGRHVFVQAWKEVIEHNVGESLIEKLNAARARIANGE